MPWAPPELAVMLGRNFISKHDTFINVAMTAEGIISGLV